MTKKPSITQRLKAVKERIREAGGEAYGSPEDLPPEEERKPYTRLDPLERAMIVHAKRKHPSLTHKQLADDFGCDERAIQRLLKKYRHMPPVKELLHGIAHEAVVDMKRASTVAAERGDPNPAEKILIHAGEIQPIIEREGRAYGPQIVVGILPGMPVPALPAKQEAPLVIEAMGVGSPEE
jgi:transcriptional regulator with XRE-family HTH domain